MDSNLNEIFLSIKILIQGTKKRPATFGSRPNNNYSVVKLL